MLRAASGSGSSAQERSLGGLATVRINLRELHSSIRVPDSAEVGVAFPKLRVHSTVRKKEMEGPGNSPNVAHLSGEEGSRIGAE